MRQSSDEVIAFCIANCNFPPEGEKLIAKTTPASPSTQPKREKFLDFPASQKNY
jgi:hypothetical protein